MRKNPLLLLNITMRRTTGASNCSFVTRTAWKLTIPALVLVFTFGSSAVRSYRDVHNVILNKDVGQEIWAPSDKTNTVSLSKSQARQQRYCENLESIPDTISSRNLGESLQRGLDTMHLRKSLIRTRNGSYIIYALNQEGYHDIRWEIGDVTAVLQKLQLVSGSQNPKDTYLLDIGANIGVFTLSAAAAGFSVLSFEAFKLNQEALLVSVCANQVLDRVTILNQALGDGGECAIYSDRKNALNGFVSCSEREEFSGSIFMHKVETYALDDIMVDSIDELAGKVGVLKIDVEGFEPKIFKGGSNFINLIKPRYILTEINSQMLSRGSNTTVKEYIEQIMDFGYTPKKGSFDGQTLIDKDIDGLDTRQQSLAHNETILLNLYFEAT